MDATGSRTFAWGAGPPSAGAWEAPASADDASQIVGRSSGVPSTRPFWTAAARSRHSRSHCPLRQGGHRQCLQGSSRRGKEPHCRGEGTAEALGSVRGLNCRGETNGLAVGSVRGGEAPTPTSLRGAASSRSCKLRPSLGRPEGFAVHCKGVALTPLGLLEPPLGWAMRVCGCRDPSWACKAPPFTGGAGRDAFSIVPPRAWWVSDPDVPFTRAT